MDLLPRCQMGFARPPSYKLVLLWFPLVPISLVRALLNNILITCSLEILSGLLVMSWRLWSHHSPLYRSDPGEVRCVTVWYIHCTCHIWERQGRFVPLEAACLELRRAGGGGRVGTDCPQLTQRNPTHATGWIVVLLWERVVVLGSTAELRVGCHRTVPRGGWWSMPWIPWPVVKTKQNETQYLLVLFSAGKGDSWPGSNPWWISKTAGASLHLDNTSDVNRPPRTSDVLSHPHHLHLHLPPWTPRGPPPRNCPDTRCHFPPIHIFNTIWRGKQAVTNWHCRPNCVYE